MYEYVRTWNIFSYGSCYRKCAGIHAVQNCWNSGHGFVSGISISENRQVSVCSCEMIKFVTFEDICYKKGEVLYFSNPSRRVCNQSGIQIFLRLKVLSFRSLNSSLLSPLKLRSFTNLRFWNRTEEWSLEVSLFFILLALLLQFLGSYPAKKTSSFFGLGPRLLDMHIFEKSKFQRIENMGSGGRK